MKRNFWKCSVCEHDPLLRALHVTIALLMGAGIGLFILIWFVGVIDCTKWFYGVLAP